MNEQIVIQDILKHIAECEYEERDLCREAIRCELGLAGDQLDLIFRDLESSGLVEAGSLKLTPAGREYALHVLRAHRLYETYLAHKTGVRDDQWHTQAHVKEHTLSANDVEQLARELDYPLYDPHGDPIPTAAGAMPPRRGQPLTGYAAGWEGRVVHVEDEPPRLYSLISAASIAPGTMLRILDKCSKKLQLMTEGRKFTFPLDAAGQITVEPLTEDEAFDETLERLSSLAEGEKAEVIGLSSLCLGLERNRMLDLGFVPGTVIEVDLVSPSGSPIAYRVRGASIALRREQSERVLIRKVKGETNG